MKTRDKRTIYFCMAYSRFLTRPVHIMIKRLSRLYGLKWLRVSMSYTRFANFEEKIAGDCLTKLQNGLVAREFMDEACNCQKSAKLNGSCRYGNEECRKKCVIYSIKCQICNAFYYGSTQNNFKTRASRHLAEVRTQVRTGQKSDSFSEHFAAHFKDEDKRTLTVKKVREICEFSIVWLGNPVVTCKRFDTYRCLLCDRERIAIINASLKGTKIINKNNEIYGSCRHKAKFLSFH